MLDTIFGLPLHPLLVHATVVIVPLAALSVLLSAVWPRFRAWAGWGPLALAAASVVLTPLSTSSGEELQNRVADTAAVQRHVELGNLLIWWVVPLVVLAAVVYWWHRSTRSGRGLAVAVAVLPVLVAVGTLVQVVLIGHSGAQSAWGKVGPSSSSSQAGGDGDAG